MMMDKHKPSLLFCIIMDIIGYATFALPFLGEFADIVWAPLSGFIFYKTFGGVNGAFGGVFNFAEEILPFTDFIPTYTIMWIWQYFTRQQPVKNLQGTSIR
jgi:hypothetical protein